MAKHYLATNNATYNHSGYGYVDGSSAWTNVYYKFTIKVSVAADGTVSYDITSTNNAASYSNYDRCQVSAWIEIGGQTVLAAAFYKNDGFPRLYNSTLSGTLPTKVTGDSVTVKTKILPASDCTVSSHTTAWNNSLKTSTLTRNYYNDPGVPATVTINDTSKNSFTISATKGSNGSGSPNTNVANGVTGIQYSFNNTDWINYTGAVSINSDSKVYARAKTDGSLSDSGYKTVGPVDVYYYTTPTQATNLEIISSKSKFTTKANYTFKWNPPTDGEHNPIQYVLFRIYKNNVQITNDADNHLSPTTSSMGPYTPEDLGGLKKNDTLKFLVDGLSTNFNFERGSISSEEISIVNSGLLRVNTTNGWKEGQAFIKTENGWKEASAVYVNTGKGWKEPK